jgi:hypothetical protein
MIERRWPVVSQEVGVEGCGDGGSGDSESLLSFVRKLEAEPARWGGEGKELRFVDSFGVAYSGEAAPKEEEEEEAASAEARLSRDSCQVWTTGVESVPMITPIRVGTVRNRTLPDGTEVRVTTLSATPAIYRISGFFSPDELDAALAHVQSIHLEPSGVGGTTETTRFSQSRTSAQAWIGDGSDTPLFRRIRERALSLTNSHAGLAEHTQVVRYEEGQHYLPHYDWLDAGMNTYYARGGNRLATLLYYLNDVPSGGHTVFPYVNSTRHPDAHSWSSMEAVGCDPDGEGLKVFPVKGDVVLFYNLLPGGQMVGEGDRLTLHGGCDPTHGSIKYLANQWIRNKRVDCTATGSEGAARTPDGRRWCLYDESW